jgi:ribosomal protein S27E
MLWEYSLRSYIWRRDCVQDIVTDGVGIGILVWWCCHQTFADVSVKQLRRRDGNGRQIIDRWMISLTVFRRRELEKTYFLDCNCPRCEDDGHQLWPHCWYPWLFLDGASYRDEYPRLQLPTLRRRWAPIMATLLISLTAFRRRELEKTYFLDCNCPRCEDGTEMGTNYGHIVDILDCF